MANRLYGDWDRFRHILVKLKHNHMQYDEVVLSMGRQISDRIRNLIVSGSLDLEPLVEDYRKTKSAEGYAGATLVRTQAFVNSIEIKDIKSDGESLTIFIGIAGGVTQTGISMNDLARFLEYGTENMIGRYPIRRSWEQMRKDVKEDVASRLVNSIRRTLH